MIPVRFLRARGALALLTLASAGCVDKKQSEQLVQAFQQGPPRPDELPKILNRELPFHYPPALYARRAQGNVLLRLYIDRDGRVHPESTRVVEPSGYASFDSAAIRGSQELRFVPAKTRGEPQAVAIAFPVYFRYPGAPALPGDTILERKAPVPPAPKR